MTDHVLAASEPSIPLDTPLPDPPDNPGGEVSLSEAAEAAGVTTKTLRRWIDKGLVQGRQVESSHGVQWLVSLSGVKEVAAEKGIGRSRVAAAVAPDTSELESGVLPAQMLVPRAEWERAVGQMGHIVDLAGELGEAKEAKGRAEAKAEHYKERLIEAREHFEKRLSRERQHVGKLEAELRVARQRRRWFGRRRLTSGGL